MSDPVYSFGQLSILSQVLGNAIPEVSQLDDVVVLENGKRATFQFVVDNSSLATGVAKRLAQSLQGKGFEYDVSVSSRTSTGAAPGEQETTYMLNITAPSDGLDALAGALKIGDQWKRIKETPLALGSYVDEAEGVIFTFADDAHAQNFLERLPKSTLQAIYPMGIPVIEIEDGFIAFPLVQGMNGDALEVFEKQSLIDPMGGLAAETAPQRGIHTRRVTDVVEAYKSLLGKFSPEQLHDLKQQFGAIEAVASQRLDGMRTYGEEPKKRLIAALDNLKKTFGLIDLDEDGKPDTQSQILDAVLRMSANQAADVRTSNTMPLNSSAPFGASVQVAIATMAKENGWSVPAVGKVPAKTLRVQGDTHQEILDALAPYSAAVRRLQEAYDFPPSAVEDDLFDMVTNPPLPQTPPKSASPAKKAPAKN